MKNIFTSHPASVGETYFEHLRVASAFGVRLFAGALACWIHAVLPWLFVSTGSRTVAHLYDTMVLRRVQDERQHI